MTPAMARAIGESAAVKLLLPVNRCSNIVIGVKEQSLADQIREAVSRIKALAKDTEVR